MNKTIATVCRELAQIETVAFGDGDQVCNHSQEAAVVKATVTHQYAISLPPSGVMLAIK